VLSQFEYLQIVVAMSPRNGVGARHEARRQRTFRLGCEVGVVVVLADLCCFDIYARALGVG